MSVIQKIRDKYARWAVIAIGLALLGFILMDAFAGRTGLFSGQPGNTLGKVNGKSIDRIRFDQRVQEEERARTAQGQELGEDGRQQIMQGLWEQEVSNIIMAEEYEKLGLTVSEKELRDILYGANPPEQLRQRFTDESGQYNAIAAQQEINRMMKDPAGKRDLDNFFEYLKNQRLMSKYMTLVTNSVYFPKWFLEKRNVDNSLMARVSYVSVPYVSIPDSSVKVSDEEIEKYIKAHENDFEQKEETRSISYVLFSAAPSAADSAATKADVEKLRSELQATTEPGAFVAQQGSAIPFYDAYLSQNAIQVPAKDSIIGMPNGSVYGPYLDVNQQSNEALYVLAKMIDSKSLPDSVKCRHILLGTMNPQTGVAIMPDSLAKFKADSINYAIQTGANFDSLNARYSTDEVAKKDGGVMTFSSTDIQSPNFAKEFGQFILFDGKQGDKKVVKTQFGWHYIEIMEHKNVSPHYKIAYVGKQIVPSPTTDQQARNEANLFAGNSQDLNAFNTNYDKTLRSKGFSKLVATDITPIAFNVNGIPGGARPFVRKIFEADKGDVIGPDRVGSNYVVAIVTEVNEPGLRSVNAVRPSIEPILKNKKKAEQIIRNLGQITTLEQVATKMNQQVQTADSIRFSNDRNLGYEPKVLGAAFNPANKGKVVPEAIAGSSGVFVVRVESTGTVPVESGSIEEQRKMLEMQARQQLMSGLQQGYNPIIESLKRTATIKDNRSKFY
jgi:peptidyl-prolyl cis-trans isomerase D